MSRRLTDPDYLLSEQYRSDRNLNARAELHRRFSTNRRGWMPWVFDQLDLPERAAVLEVGGGPGWLWVENRARIPPGWRITLTDLSSGMVNAARANLAGDARFHIRTADAQALPFASETFDAVIANHMLYHVTDRAGALAEIRRVLRPGGALYAATNGINHMRELTDLALRLDPDGRFAGLHRFPAGFTLENGYAQFAAHFDAIEVRRYPDALLVTEVEPLVEYVLSGLTSDEQTSAVADVVRAALAREMQPHGAIRITKDSGLFIARRA